MKLSAELRSRIAGGMMTDHCIRTMEQAAAALDAAEDALTKLDAHLDFGEALDAGEHIEIADPSSINEAFELAHAALALIRQEQK